MTRYMVFRSGKARDFLCIVAARSIEERAEGGAQ